MHMRRLVSRHVLLLALLTLAAALACRSHDAAAPLAEGKRGMIATSAPLATEVGVRVLRDGGNAVDAAVAVSFALGVVQPWNSGAGGGAFVLVRMKDGRTAAIDGRETAPARATRAMYLNAAGKPTRDSRTGPRAIGVPGAVAALALAHERYGTRPWKSLLAPAIALARKGFPVSARMAEMVARSRLRFGGGTEWSRIFTPAGAIALPGAHLTQEDLAKSYEQIAVQGPAALYGGELGRAIARDVAAQGGLLTIEDLRGYRAIAREPLRGRYRGYEVLTFPPPGGGAQVIEALNLCALRDLSRPGPESPEAVHLVAEALKLVFADRAAYGGDPDFVKVPTAGLISQRYARRRGEAIWADRPVRVEGGGDPFQEEGGIRRTSPSSTATGTRRASLRR
jgi:gamma-glutamyltranspeptidase/glutathione hydrolase